MARVKRGVTARRRHKEVLKAARGYYNARHKNYRVATQAVTKARQYAYIGRKQKKRQFRSLWIVRINAAARQFGLSYSRMIAGLAKADIAIDRKVLADLAVRDLRAFGVIAEKAGAALGVKTTRPEFAVSVPEPREKPVPRDRQPAPAAVLAGDDLTKIEGIGPKVAEVLAGAGIASFADLAKADAERLTGILQDAGDAFATRDPETWPRQAGLAAAGNFEELEKLQSELVGEGPT